MIQVNTIRKPLIIHIRTVPFEFGNISADMQRTQFILGDFPDYFSGNCQNLDFDILRNIADPVMVKTKAVEVVKGLG